MTLKAQAILGLILATIISLLAYIVYVQQEIINSQSSLSTEVIELKKLNNDLVRSQSSYVTQKALEKTIKDNLNLDDVKKDLNALKAEIKGLVVTTIHTPGYYGTGIGSTNTTPRVEDKDPQIDFGYMKARQELRLDEPFASDKSVPWGLVGFSAWKEKPWDLRIYPRKYSTMTVLSQTEGGQTIAHVQVTVDTEGKKYTLPISNSSLIETLPESRFRFVNKLYLGTGAGVSANSPAHLDGFIALQYPLVSYAKGKDVSWIFAAIGAGYQFDNKSVPIVLTPIAYNIGQNLPLIDNLFVGPSATLDFNGKFGLFVSLNVGL